MTESVVVRPPAGPIAESLSVPPSKSVANRALVCAMLASSESKISNLPDGDDTSALLEVLNDAGMLTATEGTSVHVRPTGLERLPPRVNARLAGTTARFMTAVASLCPHSVVIDGEEPLRRREMEPLHRALRDVGANVEGLGAQGRLPVKVGGSVPLGGNVTVSGNVSSQFASALMMIGPCLSEGLVLTIEGELVSRPYVEMTAAVMSVFGADVKVFRNEVLVESGGYEGSEIEIESDYSSAAFPIVAVLIRGGELRLLGMSDVSVQGDRVILEIVRRMGGDVTTEGATVVVRRDADAPLRPLSMDMRHCSDLVPAVAMACSVAEGRSKLTGIGFIRGKESDRLSDLAVEMRRLGALVDQVDDGLQIEGVGRLRSGAVETHADHRLAMALSLSALSSGEVQITDSGVVGKSWPDFFYDMSGVLGRTTPAK